MNINLIYIIIWVNINIYLIWHKNVFIYLKGADLNMYSAKQNEFPT